MGYNPIEDFQRKDLLESGDPDKIVRGTELQVEFDAISADLAKVRVEQGNLNYLPITGGTVNGDISARKITATEFVGGTLSATNVSGTTFAGNGAALTGMKMSQLTDVKMSSVTRDDILIWNGSAWEASDVYDIVSPLTYAGILDVTQPAPTANNGDVFVNDQEGEAHPSFKGIAGVLILEGKFVIYDAPTDEWNSPGNSADGGVNIVKAGSGIEVDSIKPSEPVVSIDRSETDTWYLASDAETSKWETVTGGIAYNDGNVGIGTDSPDQTLHVHKGSAGAVGSQANSVLTLENSGSAILQFLTPNTADQQIRFGDPQDNGAGFLNYSHATGSLTFGVNGPERLRINSSGLVGIGTDEPNEFLHIEGAAPAIALGNTSGTVDWRMQNVDNSVRWVSNPRAGGAAAERMRIDASGTVSAAGFVGDGSKLTGLAAAPVSSVNGKTGAVTLNYTDVGAQVAGSYAASNHNHSGVYQPVGNYLTTCAAGNGTKLTGTNKIEMSGSYTGTFTATGNITAYSDERLKDNVETLDGSKVYDMRGVSFTKDGEIGSGVIAQELQMVAPELVHEGDEYLSVAYGNVVGYLIEAVKDLKAEVEELKRVR